MSELLGLVLVLALMIGVYALMFRSTARGQWLTARLDSNPQNFTHGISAVTGLVAVAAIMSIRENDKLIDALAIGCGFAGIAWIAYKGRELLPMRVSIKLFYSAVGAVAFYGVVADFIWGVEAEQRGLRIVLLALFSAVSALAWTASFFMGHVNLSIGLTLFAIVEVLSYVASPLGTNLFDSREALTLSFVAAIFLGALAGYGKKIVEWTAVISIAFFHAFAFSVGIDPSAATSAATNDNTTLCAMAAYIVTCSVLLRFGANS